MRARASPRAKGSRGRHASPPDDLHLTMPRRPTLKGRLGGGASDGAENAAGFHADTLCTPFRSQEFGSHEIIIN